MDSLYAQYLRERTNDQIIENEKGFVTYRYINPNQIYIIDIYVKPSFRKQNVASDLADEICFDAKGLGCKELIGTVNPSAKGSHESMLVLIAYGMKLHSSSENVIIFKKEL